MSDTVYSSDIYTKEIDKYGRRVRIGINTGEI